MSCKGFLIVILIIISQCHCFEDTMDSIVVRGSPAHLFCHFATPTRPGVHRRMIYSSKFKPSISDDTLVWSGSQSAHNESLNRRHRLRHTDDHVTLDIGRVQFNDAGSYSCVDDSRIIFSHNLVVIGSSISLEKSFESYDVDQGYTPYYLVPCCVRIVLICSLDISLTPWAEHHPKLSIKDATLSNYGRHGHTLSYTFVTEAISSKEYTCSAVFPGEDWSSLRPISVIVIVDDDESHASYQTHVIKYAANQGDTLILSCVSRFNSNNNWKWFKGHDLNSHDIALPIIDCHMRLDEEGCSNLSITAHHRDVSTRRYSLLIFSSLSYSSSGKYSCIDSLLTVQKTFEIIVIDSSHPYVLVDGRPIGDNGTSLDFRKNQWTYISCSLRFYINSSLDTGLKLIVNDAYSLYNTSSDRLTYTYRVLMVKSSWYRCYIDLPDGFQFYGERDNFTFYANVFHCPDVLRISGNLSRNSIQRGGILNCIVSAEPPVNVSWEVFAPSSTLFISGPNFASLMVQANGDYRCKTERLVHPILGNCPVQYVTIRIDQVLTVPRSRVVKQGVLRGKSFTLRCTSHHLRNTNWKWFRNWNNNHNHHHSSSSFLQSLNFPIVDCMFRSTMDCTDITTFPWVKDYSTSTMTQLTFREVSHVHSGNYTCMDSLRTIEKTYEVQILECPSTMTISKLNWERPYGQGKELLCSVTGDPPMNVTWSFRNQSQISISGWNSARMPVFQTGLYECIVDVDHERVLGSCGSLSSRVQVEDVREDEHQEIEERR